MDKISDINVKQILYEDIFLNSRLELNISGKSINHVIMNTLRRVCLSNIPTYIYNKFDFAKNTSIYNNNYIKLRLRNIPVIGIQSSSPFFVEKNENTDDTNDESNMISMDDINLDTNYDISSSNLKQLTLYLDKTNETNNIITVGTDDCKFYYKEKEIDSPYKINIPLIKLQGGQSIKLTAISDIGIEKNDALYSPASVLYYIMNNENDYNFIVESRGQLDEYTIIKYGISNIIRILENLKNDINNLEDIKKLKGEMELENYDHTVGNILSQGLRSHKDVSFGGYAMPHLLDDKIILNFELKKNNIKSVLLDVIEYYINLFNKIPLD